jgi:hypothetical protein
MCWSWTPDRDRGSVLSRFLNCWSDFVSRPPIGTGLAWLGEPSELFSTIRDVTRHRFTTLSEQFSMALFRT